MNIKKCECGSIPKTVCRTGNNYETNTKGKIVDVVVCTCGMEGPEVCDGIYGLEKAVEAWNCGARKKPDIYIHGRWYPYDEGVKK